MLVGETERYIMLTRRDKRVLFPALAALSLCWLFMLDKVVEYTSAATEAVVEWMLEEE